MSLILTLDQARMVLRTITALANVGGMASFYFQTSCGNFARVFEHIRGGLKVVKCSSPGVLLESEKYTTLDEFCNAYDIGETT